MLEKLKEEVYKANIELVKRNVVIYTWGNVSGIDRKTGYVVIKPSGVDYDEMTPDDMVVVDLYTGNKIEGKYKPSTDTPTHLELYKKYDSIGGVTHTHSTNAVAFAQAGLNLPALGTTHADYFYGDVFCTRKLTETEVKENYELNTGKVIIECLEKNKIDPIAIPGILVKNHGPFCWGKSPKESVYHSVVLEHIADMAIKTLILNKKSNLDKYVLDKHYNRKHGSNAYYGQ